MSQTNLLELDRVQYSETLLQRERMAQAHFLAIAEFLLFPNDEFTKGNKG